MASVCVIHVKHGADNNAQSSADVFMNQGGGEREREKEGAWKQEFSGLSSLNKPPTSSYGFSFRSQRANAANSRGGG